MESNMKRSTKLGGDADCSDAKYVSGLSTILVATIQEAKDRISQIEYIFCSQLFPNLQPTYQNMQKLRSEAREAAETAYKLKEKDLLLQVKSLQNRKQELMEENQLLKSEKEKYISVENQTCSRLKELQQELEQKTLEINENREVHVNLQKHVESKSSLLCSYETTIKDIEMKNSVLLKMQKKMEVEIEELQQELAKKSQEVDERLTLQNKLLQTNQSNASLAAQKEIQLKGYEEKNIGLVSKLKNMENKVNELVSELRYKTGEIGKGKELQGNLLKKIEFQALEIMNLEQQLDKYSKENRLLAEKVANLLSRANELQNEIEKKSFELQEERKAKDQSIPQSESFKFDRINTGRVFTEFEVERKQLLDKQKDLEKEIDKLHTRLSQIIEETSQQTEVKDSELQSEKNKRKDVIAAYKRMKSQYNYLLKKYALTQETMLPVSLDIIENGSQPNGYNQAPVTSLGIEKNTSKTYGMNNVAAKSLEEVETSDDKKRVVPIQQSSAVSPSASSILNAPQSASSLKSGPAAGAKRPSSYWRDTRLHQSRLGPDPHDDFLDTPLEGVRENLGKIMKEDHQPDLTKVRTNMSLDSSNDETQDMNADAGEPPRDGASGYKYVEPVRKKSERESLKGVECKQCKKFYDAVLPGAANNTNKQNMRCEHHDGVSRHRYKYAPPSTPEGFWNIGFESES